MDRIEAAQKARATKAARNPLSKRFWDKVEIRGKHECWFWKAAVRREGEGYGAFWFQGRHQPASRIAWFLSFGYMPEHNQQVCHEYDNPKCCNPEHLFLGTYLENNQDKVSKKRHAYGERTGTSKLSEKQAKEIKSQRPQKGEVAPGLVAKLSKKYNVKPGTIYDVWWRAWRHLDD